MEPGYVKCRMFTGTRSLPRRMGERVCLTPHCLIASTQNRARSKRMRRLLLRQPVENPQHVVLGFRNLRYRASFIHALRPRIVRAQRQR